MNGAGSIPASVVTTPLGRPEALFRVGAAEQDGQGVRAQMRTGPWMRGPDSRPCAGSLGVFLDDLLGNALLAGRPEDYWPVEHGTVHRPGRARCPPTARCSPGGAGRSASNRAADSARGPSPTVRAR